MRPSRDQADGGIPSLRKRSRSVGTIVVSSLCPTTMSGSTARKISAIEVRVEISSGKILMSERSAIGRREFCEFCEFCKIAESPSDLPTFAIANRAPASVSNPAAASSRPVEHKISIASDVSGGGSGTLGYLSFVASSSARSAYRHTHRSSSTSNSSRAQVAARAPLPKIFHLPGGTASHSGPRRPSFRIARSTHPILVPRISEKYSPEMSRGKFLVQAWVLILATRRDPRSHAVPKT